MATVVEQKMGEESFIFFEDYLKVASINYITKEYRFIKTPKNSALSYAMKADCFDGYVRRLSEIGYMKSNEARSYIRFFSSDNSWNSLKSGKHIIVHGIKTRLGDDDIWTTVDISAPNGLSEDNAWVLFCLKETERKKDNTDRRFFDGCYAALEIDITNDTYIPKQALTSEIVSADSLTGSMSESFRIFAEKGVHEEDIESYLSFTDLAELRQRFSEDKSVVSLPYRRKVGNEFCRCIMDIAPCDGYSERNRKVMMYVRSEEAKAKLEEYLKQKNSYDTLTSTWNEFRFRQLCQEYSTAQKRDVGIIYVRMAQRVDVADFELHRFAVLLGTVFGQAHCYHFDGTEFAVMFKDITEEEIVSRTEKLRKKAAEMKINTAEAAVAWEAHTESLDKLLQKAKDKLMNMVLE